jgi:hypothetical protein
MTARRRRPTRRRRTTTTHLPSTRMATSRWSVQVAGLCVLLYLNASHFDSGEVRTVVGTSVIAALMEVLGVRKGAQ